jgi:alpha-1,2-mannosyltransferase
VALHATSPSLMGKVGDTWLTAKRVRAHAVIFALCLWSLFAWNLATPGLRDRSGNLKGTDFLHFYTLGIVASEHRGGELYDMNAQAKLAAGRVPQAAGIRYLPLYPPQVSVFFAPLAHLSYGWALAIWWILTATLYAWCCYVVWRACPQLREYGSPVALAAIGFPAFFHLIAWGQSSALALVCFAGAFLLLRKEREFPAGLVLGCLIFKPQLGIAAALVFIAIGAWKILSGAVISAAAQLLIGVSYYGAGPLRDWICTLQNVGRALPSLEPRPYQTQSLRTFWAMLLPWGGLALGLYLASAALILGITILLWKREPVPLSLRFSALLLATVLVAPHLTVYDLVILAPALLLGADWAMAHPKSGNRLGTVLYLIYVLPLLGPLTRWTHVQISVLAMAVAVYMLWRAGMKPMNTAASAQAD